MTQWFRNPAQGNKGWQGDDPIPAEEVYKYKKKICDTFI